CSKKSSHKEFIAVQDFLDNYQPIKEYEDSRALLRSIIDLTVRLRLNWTSPARQDDDVFSDVRGSDKLRTGTGFILSVVGPVTNESCPCEVCCGQTVAKSWRFLVRTARHMVYDTVEAQETQVDFFYDDDEIGKKETVRALKVVKSYPERDICEMLCVTHDEDLAGRVQSAYLFLDFISLVLKDEWQVLVVSHPHGKPKKITVGVGRSGTSQQPLLLLGYNAATCPGSSGAPVVLL
ncbi:hypothetical protein EGW08_001005, partial [Elysia chlorotica]